MKQDIVKVLKPQADRPRGQLCVDLGLPVVADDNTLIAELLRAVVFASTANGHPVGHEVMLDRTMEVLVACSEGNQADLRRTAFEIAVMLAALGDLTRSFDGGWGSGDTFTVDRHARGRYLISGTPIRELRVQRSHIEAHGGLRILTATTGGLPLRSVEDWAGPATEPLDQWTSSALNSDGMTTVADNLLAAADFTFYRPDAAAAAAQDAHRWTGTHPALNGRFLTRIVHYPAPDRFAIADLNDGTLRGHRLINYDAAQRLLFGVDSIHSRCASLRIAKTPADATITVGRALPHREMRLLTALASRASSTRWVISLDDLSHAEAVLQELGLSTTESGHSARHTGSLDAGSQPLTSRSQSDRKRRK